MYVCSVKGNKMKYGYARVSTEEQNIDLQIDALKKFNCDEIFSEKISSRKKNRPELEKLLEIIRPGDSLVIWKLDRLGRNVKELLQIAEMLRNKQVIFVSLQENLDTSSATGEFLFHMLCSIAQMERDIISERTKAGLAAARARGRKGGRKGIDPQIINRALKMYRSGEFKINDILESCNIKKSTLYKYIKLDKEK